MKSAQKNTHSANIQEKANAPFFQAKESEATANERTFFTKNDQAKPSFLNSSSSPTIQAKLTIGQPGDKYEREADAVADRVVRNQSAVSPLSDTPSVSPIQRKCSDCEQKEKLQKKEGDEEVGQADSDLQLKPIFDSGQEPPEENPTNESTTPGIMRKCSACGKEKMINQKSESADGTASPSLQSRLNSSKGSGSTLPDSVRSSMESGIGADFSGVRVHTDSSAVQMNKELGAQAFTHGSDIYFNEGKYDSGSSGGKHLLAHELTHTVQQGGSIKRKEAEEENRDEVSVNPTTRIQRSIWDTAVSLGGDMVSGATSGVRSVGSFVSETAGSVVDAGRSGLQSVGEGVSNLASSGVSFFKGIVNQYAPGLINLFNGGLINNVKQLISSGINRAFGGILNILKSGGLVESIRKITGKAREKIVEVAGQLASGDCSSIISSVNALKEFAGVLLSPQLDYLKRKLGQAATFLGDIWEKFGSPAFQAIQEFAGEAWQWIQEKARWIWEVTTPIRKLFSSAWNWIKEQLGIAKDTASGILSTFKEKALEVWKDVKDELAPIMGPLKIIGTILVLVSPVGPIAVLYYGAPYFWKALKWIWNNWNGWQTLLEAKDYFVDVIFPAIKDGVDWLGGKISEGLQWLKDSFSSLSVAVDEFLVSVGMIPLFSILKDTFTKVKDFFTELGNSISEAFSNFFSNIKTILSNVWKCIKPIVKFLIGLITLITNPSMWLSFIIGLAANLAWALIPDSLKIVAIDFLLNLAIKFIQMLPADSKLGPFFPAIRAGLLSFFERIKQYDADQKMLYMEKALTLAISPSYYGGLWVGILKGLIWDSIVGIIQMLYSLVTGLPKMLMGLFDFFKNLLTDIERIEQLIGRLQEIKAKLSEFIDRPDAIEQIVGFIKRSPQILFSMVGKAAESATNWAIDTGKKAAESLFNFITTSSPWDVGFKLGRIIGQIIFEILLLVFSGSIGNVIKGALKGMQWLGKGIKMLIKGLKGAKGWVSKAFGALRRVVNAGWEAAKKIGGALRGVLGKMKQFFDDLIAWFTSAIRRVFGSKVGRFASRAMQNKLKWEAFQIALDTATSPYNQGYKGVRKMRARAILRSVARGFRTIVGRPFIVLPKRKTGYWSLMVRKKIGLNRFVPVKAGEILMYRKKRWNRGKDAIIEKLSKNIPESRINTSGLNSLLTPFKDRYHYSRLDAVRDEKEDDWNIIGSMSPSKSIGRLKNGKSHRIQRTVSSNFIQKSSYKNKQLAQASKKLPLGTQSDPIPITWYKKGHPKAIGLIPNPNRWTRMNYQPPPMVPISVTKRSKTKIEIPPTQHNSFPTATSVIKNGKLHKYIEIGGIKEIQPGKSVFKRTLAYPKRKGMERKFKTLMKNYGYSMSKKSQSPDHVQDLGFDGKDELNNLWPLNSIINKDSARKIYFQEVDYRKGAIPKRGKYPFFMLGKYFIVKNIK